MFLIENPFKKKDILKSPEKSKFDLSSLEKAAIAGSTVPTELLKRMKGDLKLKSIIVGYGMTN